MEIVPQGHYYDPPEEREARYCEECSEEMNFDGVDYDCSNSWCPSRFIPSSLYPGTLVVRLAQRIVELTSELEDTKRKLQNSQRDIAILKDKLTPSQTNVVVRDTQYQIRRMDDVIEMLEEDEGYYFESIRKEWIECKKIMEQGE